jgi:hypothetical protein
MSAYMSKTKKASKQQLLNASRHEIGHCLVAHIMGQHIYGITVRRDGSGYADMDIPNNRPVANLRISIAGFVTERVLTGHIPTYANMKRDMSQSDDVADIEDLLADGRIKRDVAIPAAIAYVTKIVSEPAMRKRINRAAKRLTKTRVLRGRDFVTVFKA